MIVMVTGARGLIGSRLVPELVRAGHAVMRAVVILVQLGIAAQPGDVRESRLIHHRVV